MNWAQFKDPISHIAGAVVASWSFTKKVAGSNPFTVMTNIAEFSETFRKSSIVLFQESSLQK